ncbi:hypothetical protein F6X40_36385 [Paraburkholderia sp. UCT31]|uniref:hypothetical protein n=1 Tax=Paraburkholderia sp. UCT31 TaxID=2615209 RepID=UPI0016560F31|nr:hypothetical protein [Paraburkholderia sp. UCT31]MBC8742020.1 hypothetical protein [Paraburkholderia sp. UCT31]
MNLRILVVSALVFSTDSFAASSLPPVCDYVATHVSGGRTLKELNESAREEERLPGYLEAARKQGNSPEFLDHEGPYARELKAYHADMDRDGVSDALYVTEDDGSAHAVLAQARSGKDGTWHELMYGTPDGIRPFSYRGQTFFYVVGGRDPAYVSEYDSAWKEHRICDLQEVRHEWVTEEPNGEAACKVAASEAMSYVEYGPPPPDLDRDALPQCISDCNYGGQLDVKYLSTASVDLYNDGRKFLMAEGSYYLAGRGGTGRVPLIVRSEADKKIVAPEMGEEYGMGNAHATFDDYTLRLARYENLTYFEATYGRDLSQFTGDTRDIYTWRHGVVVQVCALKSRITYQAVPPEKAE